MKLLDHPIVKTAVAPQTQIKIHGVLLLAYFLQIPIAVIWLSGSISYLTFISVETALGAHWAGIIAALSWLSSKRVEDNGSPSGTEAVSESPGCSRCRCRETPGETENGGM
ncbi:hypothetical protein NDR87_30865 [Nocardia sp. CDC159]|uniref:Uncharacterized protein n=1 Tax=Nocardia pulmonis TaxID=2951408 RepID=A0A9X2EH04_9NOCA|nr:MULTISPECIES: hypothetical protein [Nocardia]MCM6778048.1 hypothetical protein [Nocardia pulmonis]MCM6790781.1 hypothetical protein [Nocardia sp. CDC159]